jgi:signal transduction histidine kinase
VGSIEGPALLFSHDEERLVAANDAARDLLGIPTGDHDLTLIQALGSAALASAAREARQVGRPVQIDAEVSGRELRATASVVGDEILIMVTDRTEQRRTEELRRNFVVNASHELKTPATAIQTLTEALEVSLEHASDRTPQLVARLREESDRLVGLVHDLLDLRRLEERGPLERVPVDVVALTRDVVNQLRARADEHGVELVVDVPERAYVAGLAQDLRLVVHNLVANAIQYNKPGGRVDVAVAPDGGGYVLTVADTGIGIPRQDLQRIFERFYRVDVARSREAGGTGLGLAIVRHAVERQGGSVRVDSLLGEGSTFTVWLPIESTG